MNHVLTHSNEATQDEINVISHEKEKKITEYEHMEKNEVS